MPVKKLRDEDVIAMREAYRIERVNLSEFARHFGMAKSNIRRALRGDSYKHLNRRCPPPVNGDGTLHQRGERHWNAKLTDAQVLEIEDSLARGARPPALARRFGVTAENIYRIRNRERRLAEVGKRALTR